MTQEMSSIPVALVCMDNFIIEIQTFSVGVIGKLVGEKKNLE